MWFNHLLRKIISIGLIATGFALNRRTGFSSNLSFADCGVAKSTTLAGAHIRVGPPDPTEGFPSGTRFSAPLLLANTMNMPVEAQASIEYTMGGRPSRVILPPISLAAREVKRVELREELERRGITGVLDDAGIDISYGEMPGTVIARLMSYDESKDYSFDVPIKDPKAGPSNGGYPWRLDGTYTTVLHLKNTLNKDVSALFKLSYDGGEYNAPPVTMAPYQTIAVDIRKLRDAQRKDLRGNLMPSDVESGKVMWIGLGAESIIIGRAEVSNIDFGIASSFSCSICDCGSVMVTNDPYSPFIAPNSLTVPADSTGISFGANEYRETWCDTNVWGPVAPSSTVTWSSSDTSVATVSGQTITLVSAGTTTIRGSWSDTVAYGYNCAAQQGGFGAGATLNVTPKITNIAPSRGLVGTTVSVSIYGYGFSQTTSNAVSISGSGVTATDVSFINRGLLSANLNITADAAAGNHSVTVTKSGFTSNGVTFYVQVPTSLSVSSVSVLPTGTSGDHGCDPTSDFGIQIATTYQVLDQDSPTAQA